MDNKTDRIDHLSKLACDTYQKFPDSTKKHLPKIALILSSFLFIIVGILTNNVMNLASNEIGALSGTIVGVLEGTANAPRSYFDGKEAGLSAEDTHAIISTEFSNTGKLETLVTGVTINNFHKVGDKYAALYISKGYAVFTVDLSTAEIIVQDDVITISLHKPESTVYMDELATKKIAEWAGVIFNGSTQDGYFEYLNSWNKSKQELENSIEDYASLELLAQESAKKQITNLLGSIIISGKPINFIFKESES